MPLLLGFCSFFHSFLLLKHTFPAQIPAFAQLIPPMLFALVKVIALVNQDGYFPAKHKPPTQLPMAT